MGKSIGSGAATLLASKFQPRVLILQSAYMSLTKVAQDMFGKFVGYFLSTHFNNEERIKSVKCPTLLIHGKRDDLINCKHSEALY